MRNFNFATGKIIRAVVNLCVLGIIFSACKKDSDIAQSDLSRLDAAWVKVVHASPKQSTINIGFDKDRLNYNFFNYTDYTSYIAVTTGVNVFHVYSQGSYSALLSKNLDFKKGKFYSVFVTDTLSKLDAIAVLDSTAAPGVDSVKIRFANMAPDAPPVDIFAKGIDVPLATNVAYKNASNFISYKAAADVVLEARLAGQSKVLATSDKINLQTGRIYTIMAAGFNSLASDTYNKMQLSAVMH